MQRFIRIWLCGIIACLLSLTPGNLWAQDEDYDELFQMKNEVFALRAAGKYKEAIALCQRVVAMTERLNGDDPRLVGTWLNNLAYLYKEQGRYTETFPLYRRAMALHEEGYGKESPRVAQILDNLATAHWHMSQYKEAEPLFKRGLEIREKALGPEDPIVSQSLNNLAVLYQDQGRYSEAAPLYHRALAISEKKYGKGHIESSQEVENIGNLYSDMGRYAEAEPFLRQSLGIRERNLRKDHPEIAKSLDALARLFSNQGRYAEAEPLLRRSLAIRENNLGREHPLVASTLESLASVCLDQGRLADAEALYKQALAIQEKVFGAEHLEVADTLNSLGQLYTEQRRFDEAEKLHRRALTIREKLVGQEHPVVAQSLNNLGRVLQDLNRLDEAEPLHRRALAIREKMQGPEHPRAAFCVYELARLKEKQGKYAEAEPLIQRAMEIRDKAGVSAQERFKTYNLRAEMRWKQKRSNDAIADLDMALHLAEEARGQASGGETQRAEVFANFANAYERMVRWQREIDRPADVLATIERSRARSLMDQLATASIDFLAGVPAAEAAELRNRQTIAQTRLAQLEKQVEVVRGNRNLSETEREKTVAELESQLPASREEVIEASVAIRNASPAYRQMVGKDFKPASADELQSRLVGPDGLLLEYFLGDEAGYVVVVPPAGGKVRIEMLAVDKMQAGALGIEPGPLTADRMRGILANNAGTGVLQQLRQPDQAEKTIDRLAELWTVLVPAPERKLLTEGKLKRWIVIPDAALAAFPFETLVVEKGDKPRYLLDVAPPLTSAPSATLLVNLASAEIKGGQGVLSVGDAIYGSPVESDSSRGGSALNSISAKSRYGTLRGGLKPLPFTGWEAGWVTDTFKSQGMATGALLKQNAREASVRMYGPKYEILHLACHGLVDQGRGNLFGALALTPGPAGVADPNDDGYLTLQEIYALNLHGTRLAILSACDTNFGPEQRGEGVWSLSRGFLVAGAQRVVASNWLVDDEAGASLISVFCGAVAKAQKGGTVDYAEALHAAKRWARTQDKWQSPYFWGTFVMVGPN